MSKINKLAARCKISNRPARTIYPPETKEQKAEMEIVMKEWDAGFWDRYGEWQRGERETIL